MNENLFKTVSTITLTLGACYISHEVITHNTPFLCEYDITSNKIRFGMNGSNLKIPDSNDKKQITDASINEANDVKENIINNERTQVNEETIQN